MSGANGASLNGSSTIHHPTPRSPQQAKKTFRTVFGIGSSIGDLRPRSPPAPSDNEDGDGDDFFGRSVLITTTGDTTPSNGLPPNTPKSTNSSLEVEEMKIDLTAASAHNHERQGRKSTSSNAPTVGMMRRSSNSTSRRAFRFGPNDAGPWSVSVADTGSEPKSYHIYVKTPTHNLTLTRTARELVELHSKLRDAYPTVTLPPFPLSSDVSFSPHSKRRSSFLHTLTRLATPNNPGGSSSKVNKGVSLGHSRPATSYAAGASSVPPSSYPTPTSPAENQPDPFNDVDENGVVQQPLQQRDPHQTVTSLAAYLTSVSNDPKTRTCRPWKRFVRVRTDDLESVRAERAVKRVRSDLAKHTIPKSPTMPKDDSIPPVPPIPTSYGATKINGSLSMPINKLERSPSSAPDVGTSLSLGNGLGLGGELPNVAVGPMFGMDFDASSFGLGNTSTPDILDKEKEKAQAHDREETITEKTLSQHPSAPPQPQDKRLSSVMGMSSAFSSNSDSALADTVLLAEKFGDSTPTPSAPLALSTPENVQLPPSPAIGHDVVEGLPTPGQSPAHQTNTTNSRLGRSASADPDKASRMSRQFTSSIPAAEFSANESGAEGDTSVAEGGITDSEPVDSASTPIRKRPKRHPKPPKKVTLDDFEMMRVLGKGCAGKVLLVKYKKTSDLYALKAITKRHVLAHQELQHTLTEQAVLKRMSKEGKDPFVVKLWWSFHDKDNLFLVMDFHPGGDLATQLARWGRLGRDRARFYAAEIVEGVEGLHAAGVIYRDLKPENILIGADGHIVLTDFGLSKEFPRRGMNGVGSTIPGTPDGVFSGTDFNAISTPGIPSERAHAHWGEWSAHKDVTSTFCGTAEYLAPEVIQGLPYSYEVDWWSFGTMLYEMLSGITPFWANNHSDMYVRVLQDELTFPEDRAMDQDTKSLIRGLLQRNPALRMSEPRIKRHPYFSMIDWDHVYYKRYIPPYIPPIDPSNASDTQNFDETFLEMNPTLDNDEVASESEREKAEADEENCAKTDGEESVRANSRKPEITPEDMAHVFDGYSFKGRHSVMIDEDDDGYAGYDEDEAEDELAQAKKVTDALAALHEPATPVKVVTEDTSETKTIDPKNEPDLGQQVADAISISVSPSASTAPQSALTASISTDSDSVVAARAHGHKDGKQSSEHSEGTGTTRSSTMPSLTFATTAATTPSGEYVDSPSPASESSRHLHPRIASEGSLVYEDALRAPLPLSPVIESIDPETGRPTEEEPERAKTPLLEVKAPSPVELSSPIGPSTPVQNRTKAGRRDKDLHDHQRIHEGEATEREEDDWDMVEAPDVQDRNGARGVSLWQRGVVDKYRLAVFRKGSTPRTSRVTSTAYDSTGDLIGTPSPTPEGKHRRGRTTGISLRKSTKDFLRAKSPSTNLSATASRASLAQASNAALNGGLLTPSPSGPATISGPPTSSRPKHSLKSKSSALSKNSANSPGSSDQSVTDLRTQGVSPLRAPLSPRSDGAKSPSRDDMERRSNLKKMKKGMEHGAEKMLSLFTAPRQQQQQHSPHPQ